MDQILLDIPDTFDTARLTLRSARPGDGPVFRAAVLESLDELRPWLPWAANTPEPPEAEARMRHAYLEFVARTSFSFLTFLRGSNTLVGVTILQYPDWSVPSFEIGYWVRTSFACLGYVTEAVIGLRDYAFNVFGARRLQIVCNTANIRSAAVARRAGFELEGTLHSSARHHLTNQLYDEFFFSIVRPD